MKLLIGTIDMNCDCHHSHRIILTCLRSITAILILSSIQTSIAQSADNASATDLAARESELKRKEVELLRAMGMTSDQAAPTSSTSRDNQTETITIAAPSAMIPTTDNKTASTISNRPPDQENLETHQGLETLKEIEHHPVLALDKKPAFADPGLPSTIRTYRAGSDQSDDTAKKLDTFRRSDRYDSERSGSQFADAKARFIPLEELEKDASQRPEPLQSPAIATIGISPVTLRSGPTHRHAALGSLTQYSEVMIDYRAGDWYRVKTSSGRRGWVRGPALLFDAGIPLTSAVRIGAVKAEPGSSVPR